MIALGQSLLFLFIASWIIALAAIIFALFFSIRMIFQLKDAKDKFSRKTLWNPMNAMIRPELLSDKGVISRRYALICLFVFIGSIGIGFSSVGLLRLLSKVAPN
jgi:uncharacterized membrane protein YfcA